MMSTHLRMYAFILLLVSLVCFSGTAQSCLLLVDPVAARDTCCLPVDKKASDNESSSPCSYPECQCLVCSGALLQRTILIASVTFVLIAGIPIDSGILPSGFTPRIDYPPESV